MKLFVAASAIIGSATATTATAAPSCTTTTIEGATSTVDLFTVDCDAGNATMTVTVDETCRQSDFRKVFHKLPKLF